MTTANVAPTAKTPTTPVINNTASIAGQYFYGVSTSNSRMISARNKTASI
jgi:hypothetical protein